MLTEEMQAKMTKYLSNAVNQLVAGLLTIENYENFTGQSGITLNSTISDGRIVTFSITHPRGKDENTDNVAPIK